MLRFLLNRALAHFQCPHLSTNTILVREKFHAQLYRDQSPTNYSVQLGWSDYIYPLTVVNLAL
jgi:hypothetical protein